MTKIRSARQERTKEEMKTMIRPLMN